MLKLLKTRAFSLFIVILSVALTSGSVSEARKQRGPYQPEVQQGQSVSDDGVLVRAVQSRHNQRYLEASNLLVTRLLEDDRQGLPHQRWFVELSSGEQVFVVYNLDMGQRIPLQVGSRIALGGEFKWTRQGGLMHWLHHDPRNQRPDGYVELNGTRYGDDVH